MLVAGQPIHFVLGILTVLIRTLYATTGWSIVAGDCQADSRAIAEINRLLHQSFPKGTASYDCTTVIILNGSCKDLTGGCRTFISQHNQRHFLATACSVGIIFHTGVFASLGIDYELSFRQEFIYHTHGSLHITTGVVAQVDNDSFTIPMTELSNSIQQFYMSGTSEFTDLNISVIIAEHISCINCILWNITAGDDKVQQILFCSTFDTQFYFGSFRTFQSAHGFLIGQFYSGEQAVVYHNDAVACHQSYFLGRTALNDTVHMNRIILNGELNTDTAEAAFQL